MTRSLVTGGSGFIGSHVVDALRAIGHEVVVLDRIPLRHRADVEYRAADVADFAAVRTAMKGIDYVHHEAAMSDVDQVFERPIECIASNVLGTTHVLEAARREGVKRVFLASSVWVYAGVRANVVDEETPIALSGPRHVYTSSKIAGELITNDYAALYDLPVTIFRYGVPYGPRMRDALLIPAMLERALSGRPLVIAGDGSQTRNFLYVADLARAHVVGLAPQCANQTFNLDGERAISVSEVAETICKLLDSRVRIEYVPARQGDYEGKSVSREKAARLMGWRAATRFEDGLGHTLAWYRGRHTNGRGDTSTISAS
jgi:UDP-glucose 4-epimerase